MEILRLIAEGNRTTRSYKPAIGLSQNYAKEPDLFATVLETEALPVPNDYTPIGKRTLAAAIKLMSKQAEMPASVTKLSTATTGQLWGSLTVQQAWAVITAVFSALAAMAGSAYWLGKTHR